MKLHAGMNFADIRFVSSDNISLTSNRHETSCRHEIESLTPQVIVFSFHKWYLKVHTCYFFFLFENSSQTKIINENNFFKNNYSQKLMPTKYFKQANSRKLITATWKIFQFVKLTSFKVNQSKHLLFSCAQ